MVILQFYKSVANIPEELTIVPFLRDGTVLVIEEEQSRDLQVKIRRFFDKLISEMGPVRVKPQLVAIFGKNDGKTRTIKEITLVPRNDLIVTSAHGVAGRIVSAIKSSIRAYKDENYLVSIVRCLRFYCNVVAYVPPRGSSYMELPDGLKDSKGLINVKIRIIAASFTL
jgi:hypothetical protein